MQDAQDQPIQPLLGQHGVIVEKDHVAAASFPERLVACRCVPSIGFIANHFNSFRSTIEVPGAWPRASDPRQELSRSIDRTVVHDD